MTDPGHDSRDATAAGKIASSDQVLSLLPSSVGFPQFSTQISRQGNRLPIYSIQRCG